MYSKDRKEVTVMIKKEITDFKEAQAIEPRVGGFTGLEKLDKERFESASVYYRNKHDFENDIPYEAKLYQKLEPSKPSILDLMAVAYGNNHQKHVAYQKFEQDGTGRREAKQVAQSYLKG